MEISLSGRQGGIGMRDGWGVVEAILVLAVIIVLVLVFRNQIIYFLSKLMGILL